MKPEMRDISAETFGKYQCGTTRLGYDWADSDFGVFGLKWGALSSPFFLKPRQKRIRYVPIISEIKCWLGVL